MRVAIQIGSCGIVFVIYHIMSHELISETIVRLTAVKASHRICVILSPLDNTVSWEHLSEIDGVVR